MEGVGAGKWKEVGGGVSGRGWGGGRGSGGWGKWKGWGVGVADVTMHFMDCNLFYWDSSDKNNKQTNKQTKKTTTNKQTNNEQILPRPQRLINSQCCFCCPDPLSSGDSSGEEALQPMEDDSGQSQASWLRQVTTWEEQYRAWNMYFQQLGADAELPQSNSGDILAGLAQDESAASVRTNSREWSSLASDWSTAHSAYNMTYNGMCYSY